jgi:hypothetical protein
MTMTALTRIVVGGSLKKPSTSNFRPVGPGPTSDQDALRVRRMSKTFPGTRALVDVDLTVRAGKCMRSSANRDSDPIPRITP